MSQQEHVLTWPVSRSCLVHKRRLYGRNSVPAVNEKVFSRWTILGVPVEVLVIEQRPQPATAVVRLLPLLMLVVFVVFPVFRRQFQRTRQRVDGIGQVVAVRLDAVQLVEDEVRVMLQKRRDSSVIRIYRFDNLNRNIKYNGSKSFNSLYKHMKDAR
ncbi:hypothetical protein AVEN_101097-1 [Araneus ventricosus]|uniref:Uncharacterized protein n=1 Tax=Araneus ventricosus TaxID=182803 RepID=A0A4Y2J078_ARAVE|nr:hypothetical protein AVEN_101097-1 [Araneus ventricosus]